ncbi:MAG: LysE family transporter [Bacteroidales bacterium]|nr:LysE family transporter [Bacteroidales bacterium]
MPDMLLENTPVIFDKIPEISRIGSFSFLFWAISIGLFLSVVVNMGPAFITLVQTSLHRGFRSAAWFATGVILNDALVVTICILTSVQVVTHTGTEAALACIGAGVVLILFGIFTYRKRVKNRDCLNELMSDCISDDEPATKTSNPFKHPSIQAFKQTINQAINQSSETPAWYVFLGKGFALNILNPFVWLLWFSSVAIVAGKMGGNKVSTVVFFCIILGTTFAIELLKGWGAAKLKIFLTPERTTIINKIAGIMLIICGAYFIIFRGILPLF